MMKCKIDKSPFIFPINAVKLNYQAKGAVKVEAFKGNFTNEMSACKDLISLRNLVSKLLNEDDDSVAEVYSELVNLYQTNAIKRAFGSKPYAIYSGSNAAINFMLFHITTAQTGQDDFLENTRKRFKAFISLIDENIIAPTEPLVLKKDVEFIIKGIDNKYSLFSTIFYERKLSILRVSNTHLNCNALCCTKSSSMGIGIPTINYELFLFHEREGEGWHPAFIFLHELGHILQTEISRSPAIPPKSFVQMLNQYQGPRIKQDKESAELFADAFAVAMITVFGWDQFAPSSGFPPTMSEVYSKYMDWLICEFLAGNIEDI